MKFTIIEKTWRCYNRGEGNTQLLNNEGYMCCLGHIACQLGYKKDDLLGKFTPKMLPLNDNILRDKYDMSKLSCMAIGINDTSTLNHEQRKEALINLFKENGHEIEFIA